MAERWDVWRELEARWPRVVFGVAELPPSTGGAVWYSDGDGSVIVLDANVDDPRLRTHLLAHELVHDERHGTGQRCGAPDGWAAVVAREERTVERIVAERLVPLDDLEVFIEAELSLENGVDAHDVAEKFDVTEAVARMAMVQLGERLDAELEVP